MHIRDTDIPPPTLCCCTWLHTCQTQCQWRWLSTSSFPHPALVISKYGRYWQEKFHPSLGQPETLFILYSSARAFGNVGLESTDEYISSIPAILQLKRTLIMVVFSDSMCSASSLSPHKVHRSTAPRNLCNKIHRIARELCSKLPCLEIYFAHLGSTSLPADLNSKYIEKPLNIANSKLWREGPQEYFNINPPLNWFMKLPHRYPLQGLHSTYLHVWPVEFPAFWSEVQD